MGGFVGYRCSICGREYGPKEVTYTCPRDGGNLDVILDYRAIHGQYRPEDIFSRRETSIWRYLPLLPVGGPGVEATPLNTVGWTPMYAPRGLAEQLGLRDLWIKDEGRNPTASFKDRASALVVARAIEIGAPVIATASTGNAGAALAGMAGAAGQKAVIVAPKSAPQAKIAQLAIYGAEVVLVDGTYDQAFDLVVEASQAFGWYCRNTGYNPFTAEGKKTAAFEIWESLLTGLGERSGSLSIFIPVGDGNIISGIHKGFKDLQAIGWLPGMPRLFGVQAEGSAAIARAFLAGGEQIEPVEAHTIADSISVDLPRDGVRAVRAVRETGGQYELVSDVEILQAIAELGRAGIFAEPAGATAFAGLKKALSRGAIRPADPVLVLLTGSGLKDVQAALQAVAQPPVIPPSLEALRGLGISERGA